MDLIPGIDIRAGRAVRLVQGDYDRETVFADDPVAVAKRWAAQGARRLHVVDLDGARERRPVNDTIVERIIRESGLRVQVAGGMSDASVIDRWASTGADRIVIGTLALQEPDVIEAAVRRHGDRIAVAIDVREGKAALKGWLETSETPAEDVVRAMSLRDVRHFVYTDISRDGMMRHLDFASVKRMLEALIETGAPATMIYSGGVTSIADLVALAQYGLEGVIIGRALYDGSFTLADARIALATGDDG